MGIDFCAIMEYPEFSDVTRRTISKLESSDLGSAFADLEKLAIEKKQYSHVFKKDWHWETRTVNDSQVTVHKQKARPELPSKEWSLSTAAGFEICFGKHLASIYHPLRWRIFISDSDWQEQMLKSLGKITDWFSATGCVVSHDCTAVVTCLEEDSLQVAIDESVADWGAFEAQSLAETVRQVPSPKDAPPDEKFYDSNGFWRFLGGS